MKFRSLIATAVAAVGLSAMAAPSFAVTFASFQTAVTGTPYTFTNNSTSANNLKLTANFPVTFEFLVPNLYGPPLAPISAQLVITATAGPTPASGVANPAGLPNGTNFIQPFSNVQMSFTAIGGPHPGSNLLTLVSGSTGELQGKVNGGRASFGGDTGTGNSVTFTSDFLFFNNTLDRLYDLEFTGINPTLHLATHTSGNHRTTGFPNTFVAAGNGTFDSTPAPNIGTPEPSPALALLFGGAGLVLLFVRNRKTASARPLTA
jgi:hypothetical protein